MILSRRKLLISAAALALVLGVASSPQLLGAHVASAFESLRGAERHWLLVAALGFVAAFACTVGAWRAALSAAGGRVCPKRAAASLGVGAMVNSFAPAKLGDAVKIALFSKAIDAPGRIWTAGGVYAALAAARSLMLAALLVAASADRRDAAVARVRALRDRRRARRGGRAVGPPPPPSADRPDALRPRRARAFSARAHDGARVDGRHGARAPRQRPWRSRPRSTSRTRCSPRS